VHDDECFDCGEGGDLLCCDSCPHVYHMECLSPPLENPPQGLWFCPECCEGTELQFYMLDTKSKAGRKRKRKTSVDADADLEADSKIPKPRKPRASKSPSTKPRKPREPRDPNKPKQPRAKKPKKEKVPKIGKKRKMKKRIAILQYPKEVLDAVKTLKDTGNKRSDVDNNCCPKCSSRETIRAIINDDEKLLDKALKDNKNVSDPLMPWSADCHHTAMDMAIRSNNVPLARKLLQYYVIEQSRSHWGGGWTDEDEKKYPTRVSLPTNNIASNTGSTTFHSYGHGVRKISASRGGQEGNDAFVRDNYVASHRKFQEFLESCFQYGQSVEMLELFINCPSSHKPESETFKQQVISFAGERGVYIAAESGNILMLAELMKLLGDRDWGFNRLHRQVLATDDSPLPKSQKKSATKKPLGNYNITPAHFAAINPNARYLKELCALAGTTNMTDKKGRRPVHFAACCSTTAPLEYLVEAGVSITEPDEQGSTPLFFAARYGKTHNILLLIPKAPVKEEKEDKADVQKDGEAKTDKDKGEDDEGDEDGGDDEDKPKKKLKKNSGPKGKEEEKF